MFQRKTKIEVEADASAEDALMELILEAGADDLENDDGFFTITGPVECLEGLSKALDAAQYKVVEAGVTKIPENKIEVGEVDRASTLMKLIEKLEDLDDVQAVYTNADIPDNVAEALDAE